MHRRMNNCEKGKEKGNDTIGNKEKTNGMRNTQQNHGSRAESKGDGGTRRRKTDRKNTERKKGGRLRVYGCSHIHDIGHSTEAQGRL